MITSKADRAAYKKKIYAAQAAWRKANPEKIKAKNKAWQEANPEKIKAYREANAEKIKAKRMEYRKANHEKTKSWCRAHYRANRAKYRAHEMARENRIAKQTPAWADIKKMEDIYRRARESGMHVDHYFPIKGKTVCGLHVEHNLQLLTPYENISKGNRMPKP